MRSSELSIAVLLPDVLGTYSDAGNAAVLAARARWAGVPVEVLHVTADRTPPAGCDLYLLGGGEDAAQSFAVRWLSGHRRLVRTLAESATTLAVCAGLQVLGTAFTATDGTTVAGVGVLPLRTTPGRRRAVGRAVVSTDRPDGVGLVSGFENHRGVTELGPGLRPLGRVIVGTGNGVPQDGTRVRRRPRYDGVLTDRVLGTYLHGPVLALNPGLADLLLHRATGHTTASFGGCAPASVSGAVAAARSHYLRRVRWRRLRHRTGTESRHAGSPGWSRASRA